jgi:hypothetical protein
LLRFQKKFCDVHNPNLPPSSRCNGAQAFAIGSLTAYEEGFDREKEVETDLEDDDLAICHHETSSEVHDEQNPLSTGNQTGEIKELAVSNDCNLEPNLDAILQLKERNAVAQVSRSIMFG